MADPQPFLVYRDRIGAKSEAAFLRRQYIGFTRLRPIWTGRTIVQPIGPDSHRLGGPAPLGTLRRMLFRHAGIVPPLPPGLAPVLHAQFARGGALALPLVRAHGMKLAITLHGGDVSKQKNWRNTLLARRWPDLLRETSRFICVSRAVADIARERGVPEDKLTVLPIGVEIPDKAPQRRPETHLFIGRFVEKKGIAVLIQAIRRLRAEGDRTPVVFIGDGPLRQPLEALANEVPGVTLAGWLSQDQIADRLSGAFSLLVPSVIASDGDAEGLPSVIPEAMARTCPVIGSDQGGIAEALRHNVTGVLVPPGDAAALAGAMRRVSSDWVLNNTIGAAAYADAAARLNARLQSEELEALLLSLIEETQAGR
jgi:glycosyltransferase involved in cell wall biosynthesis